MAKKGGGGHLRGGLYFSGLGHGGRIYTKEKGSQIYGCPRFSLFFGCPMFFYVFCGSNSAASRAWKACIQTNIADKFKVFVTVSHSSLGTSKWNPIEHRLFSEISKNWQGQPLKSYLITTMAKPTLR
jgi:hypothetical protein